MKKHLVALGNALLNVAFAGLFAFGIGAGVDLMNLPNDLAVWGGVGLLAIVLTLGWIILRWRAARACEWVRTKVDALLFTVLIAIVVTSTGCYKVIEPGHAGIKVEQTGGNRGGSQIPIETGRVFYNPFNEYVLDYPTNVQRAIWTASPNEGQRTAADKTSDNEEISFQSSDQLHFTCDVAVAYQLTHEKVPAFYVQFRSDDILNFTHGFFRDAVRKAIGLAAQHYTQEEINGGRQADLESEAQASLTKAMEPYGVHIIQLAFTSPPRPPATVKTAIEGKIAATQRAEQ